jgi:hypothetical protein
MVIKHSGAQIQGDWKASWVNAVQQNLIFLA